MAQTTEIPRGTRPAEYKDDVDADLRRETGRWRMWRARIDRAAGKLGIKGRSEAAKEGDRYLHGTKEVKASQQLIYLRYLLPLLEEAHRRTLPRIPSTTVEPRSEAADTPVTPPEIDPVSGEMLTAGGPTWAELCRELVDLCLASPYSGVGKAVDEAQWDDDKGGIAFFKTIWRVEFDENTPTLVEDQNRLGLQVERATQENAEPGTAKIAEDDVDYVHLAVHGEAYNAASQELLIPPEIDALREHMQEHRARMLVIRRERPLLLRVPWHKFVYDADVPWEERRWEAEERSVRIQELIDSKYKNINSTNLPAEERPGDQDGEIPYEDKTARIFDIHDRHNGKRLIISAAQGQQEGVFLHDGAWPYQGIDIYQPFVTRPCDPGQLHGEATVQVCIPILERLASLDFHIARHVEAHSDYKMGGPAIADSPEIKSGLKNPNQRFIFKGPPEAWAMMKEIKPPPIPPANLEEWGRLMSELRRVVGVDAQDTGASHPHQISATESFERGEAKQDKRTDKQKKMGEFLARVSKNFLMLYKRFGTIALMVRILGPEGAVFQQVMPAEIPDELDIFLDIGAESDVGREQQMIAWEKYVNFIMTSQIPTDVQKLSEAYGRRLGIPHPEQFRLELPEGPQNVQNAPGGSQGKQGAGTLQFPTGNRPYTPPGAEQTATA